MKKLSFINRFLPSYKWKVAAIIICGVVVGGGGLFMYLLRAHTYLGDEPSACVNCHIMAPYYATWFHSSHSRDATCNDCHVPHENAVKKWTFKGMDGMKHVAAFLIKSEPQVIRAHEASSEVIMNNCIRCHTQLNTEFVKTGKIDYMMSQVGEGKACWDCHRDVPHGEAIRCHLLPMHWYLTRIARSGHGCKRCLRNNEIKSIYLWKRN